MEIFLAAPDLRMGIVAVTLWAAVGHLVLREPLRHAKRGLETFLCAALRLHASLTTTMQVWARSTERHRLVGVVLVRARSRVVRALKIMETATMPQQRFVLRVLRQATFQVLPDLIPRVGPRRAHIDSNQGAWKLHLERDGAKLWTIQRRSWSRSRMYNVVGAWSNIPGPLVLHPRTGSNALGAGDILLDRYLVELISRVENVAKWRRGTMPSHHGSLGTLGTLATTTMAIDLLVTIEAR